MRNFEDSASSRLVQHWWNIFNVAKCLVVFTWMLILNFHNNFSNLLSRLVCSILNKKANQKDLVRFLTLVLIVSGFAISLYLICLIHSVIAFKTGLNYMFLCSKKQNMLKKQTINRSTESKTIKSVVFQLIQTNKLNVYPAH